jgi:hypothetical protein
VVAASLGALRDLDRPRLDRPRDRLAPAARRERVVRVDGLERVRVEPRARVAVGAMSQP